MFTIIHQYTEKVNLATSHGQRLEDEHAKVSVMCHYFLLFLTPFCHHFNY